MKSEYEIAVEKHNLIIPVGCTGYMAKELWIDIKNNLSNFYTNIDKELINAFENLNVKTENKEIINNIISFIEIFNNGKHSPI